MSAAWSPLVLAPPLGFLALTYAMRPYTRATGSMRLAAIRAALVTGGYAVLTVELLGALHLLTAHATGLAWAAFLTATGGSAWWRWHHQLGRQRTQRSGVRGQAAEIIGQTWAPATDRSPSYWRTAGRGERLMAGTIGGLLLVELVIAVLAEPNNFDSQTYHLPKVEHWAAQGDLDFWPTAIHRQVTIPPGAEYLLLHLRLLTGGDALYNLVQWAAGVGCLLIASRIVGQLGGGRRAQLIAAFVLATTPMVTLQATSTQTDLVVAAWAGCVASLALNGLNRRATAGSIVALGAATGLTAITKTSGLLGAGPMLLLWGVAQLRLVLVEPGRPPARSARVLGSLRVLGSSVAILAVAAVVTGPFLARVTAEFGHPLGPPRLRESIPMQRHDPGSILVNTLRIGHTALDTPLGPLRDAGAATIVRLAGLIGVDPQDRATTFGTTTFPVRSWYPDEDRVAFPLAGTLALIGGVVALARPRRMAPAHPVALRAYAATVGAAVLLYCATVKWQPWGNRLLLFALVLAVPLVGLWLDAVLPRRPLPSESAEAGGRTGHRRGQQPTRRSGRSPVALGVASGVAVLTLATSALAGVLAVSYGFPRRLVGTGSLLTTDEWQTRFLRRPQWRDEFRWAAAAVRATNPRRVGLVQQNDDWEYPWWLLLRDDEGGGDSDGTGRPEIVALQSVLPGHPPADPATVDAIVCTGSYAACRRLVPTGWQIEFRDYVGYALPSG